MAAAEPAADSARAHRDDGAVARSSARAVHLARQTPPHRHADGPERIFGEWWKADVELSAVRDYFQVEDEAGARFWLYRQGDGADPGTGAHRWFIQGLFG